MSPLMLPFSPRFITFTLSILATILFAVAFAYER